MLRSTFLGYKVASSALRVSQNQLDVVGQNMSNVDTKGYTRQRLDVNSVSFNTSSLKFGTNGVIIGQGVEASGISQYRDAFLDLRYRMESAKAGKEEVEFESLSDLESVLDEISKDKLEDQFSELTKKLQALTGSPSDPVIEGVVRTSASMLCQMFNDYSKNINKVSEQQQSYLKNEAVVEVNQLMKNISELNQQIREDNISGNPALELNDKRNTMIDKLSSYLDIEVNITPVSIGGGKTIDELSIKLRDNNMMLVDGKKYAEISSTGKDIKLTKTIDTNTVGTDLTNVIEKGKIAGYLNFINGKGEFADTSLTPPESSYRGVQYYSSMIDTLANKFAGLMNDCNKADKNNDGVLEDKPLFEARGGGNINAGNIKISDAWQNTSESYITNTKSTSTTDNTGATDNILKMISLFKDKQDFSTSTSNPLFKGTMQEFMTYTITSLNLQTKDAGNSYDTYSETQFQIDYDRRSLSSIDLNEEGVSLLQYGKSYNAAARLMTTLDEMLDTLINRMAV